MLVLGRKLNETIVLPELGIVITLCRVAGRAASIGVQAPRGVSILRGELEQPPASGPELAPPPR